MNYWYSYHFAEKQIISSAIMRIPFILVSSCERVFLSLCYREFFNCESVAMDGLGQSETASNQVNMRKKFRVFLLYYDYRPRESIAIGYRGAVIHALNNCIYELVIGYLIGQPSNDEAEFDKPYREIFFNFSKHELKNLKWKGTKIIKQTLRRYQFDLVVADRYKPCYVLAMALSKFPHCQRVAICHTLNQFNRLGRVLFARFYLSRKWTIVGVSDAVKNDLYASACGFQYDRLRVIGNCLDIDALRKNFKSRQAARQRLGIAENDLVIGHIGRLVPVKAQAELIKAFANMRHRQAKLVIIGSGREAAHLKQSAMQWGVADRVIFSGWIDNASELMKAFDVFALSSTKEAFGLVLIEAMAAKVPVLALNRGGVAEVLGIDATLSLCEDFSEFSRQLDELISLSPKAKLDLVNYLYQRCREKFDLAVGAKSYDRLFQSLLT